MATTSRTRRQTTAAQPLGFDKPSRHGLRFYQVEGDRMEPTIRHRDFVLLAPTSRFLGDGYYLVANMYGDPVPYSCDGFAGTRSKPRIRMCAHNKHYAEQTMPLASFEERVLGKIAMICNVVDHRLLPNLEVTR